MKKIGKILLIIGLVLAFSIACIDDSEIILGMSPSFESLFIKMMIAMFLMISGTVLINRGENHGRRKKF